MFASHFTVSLSLQKELEVQEEKKTRANKMISKLKSSISAVFHEERDINVRELRELNKSIINIIAEVAQNHPVIASEVNFYFDNAGIIMNSTSSAIGSRPSSIGSVRSSMSAK